MKYLLLIVIVVVILLLARAGQRRVADKAARRPPQPPEPSAGAQPMLACAHCGIHLPRDESLPGRGGVFCDEAHRAAFERAHPDT